MWTSVSPWYWGNLSGALVAHPTGGKPSVVGTVYQNPP